ncbi:hypothetical protein AMECASPLE_038577 [Ameca splendens]|uniref:Uncharacterized protein n=1 Tax=Ameca splendens TaxID=208324 RepID=A0ABV0XXA6_9TELE
MRHWTSLMPETATDISTPFFRTEDAEADATPVQAQSFKDDFERVTGGTDQSGWAIRSHIQSVLGQMQTSQEEGCKTELEIKHGIFSKSNFPVYFGSARSYDLAVLYSHTSPTPNETATFKA